MSTAQHPVNAFTPADPAATEPPTTTVTDASADPVRPLGTDSLTLESRPEVGEALDHPTSPTAAGAEKTSKKEVVIESQPINEGILGYKAPGLVKSLIFSKKFFWFSDEPLESKHLSEYLRAEKPEFAHHNVAHASQTGKGLLFFAKRAEDKNHPAGILNLSDATDLSKGDFNDFTFKLNGHKHGFQAPTKAERDGWLVAIENKSKEAQASREGLVGSEGYKSQFEQLAKPSALATTPSAAAATTSRSASRPKKSLDASKVHDGTTKSDNVAVGGTSSDEDKTKGKGKDRSQSRKRGSIFTALLGKKEEHDEKKEVKKEEKADDKAIKQEIKAIKQEVKEEDKAEQKAEKEDDKIIKQEIESIKKEVENDDTIGKENLGKTKEGNIIEPGPLDTAAVVSRALGESTEGTQPITAKETVESKGAESSTGHSGRDAHQKPIKRNSIFNSFFGKKEATSPLTKDSTTTSPTKDSETTAVSATAPRLDDPVGTGSSEPSTTAPVSIPSANTAEGSALVDTPSAQATTPDPVKEKRRSSFFGTLGTKKEKRSDVTSDTDIADGEGKKSTPTKFGGLFRKPSRAATSGNRNSNNATSATPAVIEPTESPTSTSKDAPVIPDDTGAASEPASTGQTQHTPVTATA
ncbi:hypothetical protein MMC22_005426 [Lobaria immixta]|nr:hypothetical protein [Lobaria immixta]